MREYKAPIEETNEHTWFEVPIVKGSMPDDEVCPPFECDGEATFIYRDSFIYAKFADLRDRREADKLPGSRRLTADEACMVDAEMPFPYLAWTSVALVNNSDPDRDYVGLGDVLGWLLGKFGFPECEECRTRKSGLNRISVWRRRRPAM